MAAYPSIALWVDSQIEPIFPTRITSTGVGGQLETNSHGVTSYRLTLVHRLLSSADKDTLKTFLETNELASDIDVTYGDGETYRCMIAEDGWTIQPQINDRWMADVNLVGVEL